MLTDCEALDVTVMVAHSDAEVLAEADTDADADCESDDVLHVLADGEVDSVTVPHCDSDVLPDAETLFEEDVV